MSSEAGLIALIEHLRAKGGCSNPRRVVIVRRDEDKKQATIVMPPCKLWACPECGERNKAKWMHRVMYGVDHYKKQGKEFNFVTITLGGIYRAREDSIQGWRRVWPKVRDRHSRVVGRQPYTVIPECHRNGRVHLHMVISGGIERRWWKDNVYQCGGGFIAECKPIAHVGGIAAYITKYIGKSLAMQHWPHGYRRIRVSHQWPKEPEKPKDTEGVYSVINIKQIEWTVGWLWRMGYHVKHGMTGEIVEAIDLQ